MNNEPTEAEYRLLCRKVLELTSLDLSGYKPEQTRRRLRSIMLRLQVADYASLLRLLEQNPAARQEFRDLYTINVSEFFRDPEFWEELRLLWLPQLLARRKNTTLRIWSAACSVGPEPYSLAILLEQYFPNQPYQIIATDLDRTALLHARQGGPYSTAFLNKMPTALLQRYFTKKDAGFYIDPKLQTWLNFRPHNLQEGPFASRYDLIVCRNVIIYFSAEAKHTLYPNLAHSLRPGGILFVGGAEFIYQPEKYGLRSLSGPFYTAT